MALISRSALALGVLLTLGCVEGASTLEPGPPEEFESSVSVIEVLPEGFYDEAGGFARRAIEAYLATSDAITADGGRGHERMRALVTPTWLPREDDGFSYYRDTGERTVGRSVLESSQVQLARRTPEGILDIGVITCIDTTKVLVLGPEDEDPSEAVWQWLGTRALSDAPPEDWETIEAYFEQTSARPGDRRAIVFWLVGESLDQLRVDHSEQWWGLTLCQ